MADDSNAEPPPRYFVDSNIIGALADARSPHRVGYLAMMAGEEFADRAPSVSMVVVSEIVTGLRKLEHGTEHERATAAKVRVALGLFEVVGPDDVTDAVAESLRTAAIAVGHPIGAPSQSNDLEIAAVAIRHRAPLLSHNYRDFVNIDALDLRTLAEVKRRPPRVTADFSR